MDLKESTEQVQDILWTLQIVQNQNRIVNGPNRHKRTRPVQFIDHLDASEPVQLRSWKAKLPSTGPVQHRFWTVEILQNQSNTVFDRGNTTEPVQHSFWTVQILKDHSRAIFGPSRYY